MGRRCRCWPATCPPKPTATSPWPRRRRHFSSYRPLPAANELCEPPRHADFLELPHGLHGYFDLEQAKRCARAQKKPIFIDFTGHACVNCRKMEATVWTDPQVLKRLRKDYVVVALYVDDKTELPENEWYTSQRDNKQKTTLGKQNADFQISGIRRKCPALLRAAQRRSWQPAAGAAYSLRAGCQRAS